MVGVENMDYKLLIEKAKEYINEGFADMGGKIEGPTMVDWYMLASAIKSIRFSNAIIRLCEEDFTKESLPVLRSLIEHSINMRWIMAKDTERRLKQYLHDLEEKSLGKSWTNVDLLTRMSNIGFKNSDYYDFVVKYTYSYAHVNASTLDWGEVMDEEILKSKMSSQSIHSIIAQMLGHVLLALNTRYRGKFDYYREIWRHIKKNDKNIRKEFEAIVSSSKV